MMAARYQQKVLVGDEGEIIQNDLLEHIGIHRLCVFTIRQRLLARCLKDLRATVKIV